jgi:hypothetical protein
MLDYRSIASIGQSSTVFRNEQWLYSSRCIGGAPEMIAVNSSVPGAGIGGNSAVPAISGVWQSRVK